MASKSQITKLNQEIVLTTKIQKLAENPTTLGVVEFITGLAISNRKDLLLSAGRIAQSALKGSFHKRLATEIVGFRKKGTIEDKTLNSIIGRDSLSELLEFIESGVTNEELFIAMKSIFLTTVSKTSDEKGREVGILLLRVCKQLQPIDVLVLKACYDIYKNGDERQSGLKSHGDWVKEIDNKIGYGLPQLVGQADDRLVQLGLLTERTHGDKSGIKAGKSFRLTEELGLKMCEFITNYPY